MIIIYSLNPYSNGIYSMRERTKPSTTTSGGLNPYSNGIYSMSSNEDGLIAATIES